MFPAYWLHLISPYFPSHVLCWKRKLFPFPKQVTALHRLFPLSRILFLTNLPGKLLCILPSKHEHFPPGSFSVLPPITGLFLVVHWMLDCVSVTVLPTLNLIVWSCFSTKTSYIVLVFWFFPGSSTRQAGRKQIISTLGHPGGLLGPIPLRYQGMNVIGKYWASTIRRYGPSKHT